MREWLVDLVGVDLAPIASWALAAAIVIILVFAVITIAKKALGGLGSTRVKGRGPRLAVMDVAAIDPKRKLVLVRRDEVEHLLLIGGQNDLVVEPHILRVPAAGRASRPEPTLRPEPEASLAPDRVPPAIAPPPSMTAPTLSAPSIAPLPASSRAAPSRLQPSAARPQDPRLPAASPLTRQVPRPPVADAPSDVLRQGSADTSAFQAPPVVDTPVVAPPVTAPVVSTVPGTSATIPPMPAAPSVTVDAPARDESARREPPMTRDSEAAPRIDLGSASDRPAAASQDVAANGSADLSRDGLFPAPAQKPRAAAAPEISVRGAERTDPVIGTGLGPVMGDAPEARVDRPRTVDVQGTPPVVMAAAPLSDLPRPSASPEADAGIEKLGAGPEVLERRPLAGSTRMPIDIAPGSAPLPVQRTEISPLARTPAASGGVGTGQPPLTRTPIGDGSAPVRRPPTLPTADDADATLPVPIVPAPSQDASTVRPTSGATPGYATSAPPWSPLPPATPKDTAVTERTRSGATMRPAADASFAPQVGEDSVPTDRTGNAPSPQPPAPPPAPAFSSLSAPGQSSGLIAAAERQREALKSRQATTATPPAERPSSIAATPPASPAVAPPPPSPAPQATIDDVPDRRPLSVRSFATTIQAMKPSYEPPLAATPAQAPAAGPAPSGTASSEPASPGSSSPGSPSSPASSPIAAPATQATVVSPRLSVPPFVTRIVEDRQTVPSPAQTASPAPRPTAPALDQAPPVVQAASVAPAASAAALDSDGSLEDFLSAELDSDFGNLSWDEDAPAAGTPPRIDPPERPSEPAPRALTLEEEMQRLLGDFDFEVSDRKTK